jgi:hypothetical protein
MFTLNQGQACYLGQLCLEEEGKSSSPPDSATYFGQLCLLLWFWRSAGRLLEPAEEFAAVRECDKSGIGDVPAVLAAKAIDRDLIADFQFRPLPAPRRKASWTTEFEAPFRDLSVLIFLSDVYPGVWIDPFELRHGAGNRDEPVFVVLGSECMMRGDGHAHREQQ